MSTAPSWTEVRAAVPCEWAERVAEVLGEHVGNGALIGTPSIGTEPPPAGLELVRVYVPTADDSTVKRAELARTLADLGRAAGSPALEATELGFRVLPPEDWASSWKKVWRPFRVGRLEVLAPWTDRPERSSAVRLVIEPGAVFGSGRHATTRTSLRVLTQRVQGGESVLDCGTGSGILAVAAVLLGARGATGFDLDPHSEPAATALAASNGVGERCRFSVGGFDEQATEMHDIVCANIYADVLQGQARRLAGWLKPNGLLVASGCSLPHREATRAAFGEARLNVLAEHVRGRWVTFACTRPI